MELLALGSTVVFGHLFLLLNESPQHAYFVILVSLEVEAKLLPEA